MSEPADKPIDGTSAPVIKPVEYQPAPEETPRRLPLSPVQIALIAIAVPILAALWFLFSAKSVRLDFAPAAETVEISGGLSFELGGVYLLTGGSYRVRAEASGYYPIDQGLIVTDDRNQVHQFTFTRLPGRVTFESLPPGAQVLLGDEPLGTTPTPAIEIPAGQQPFTFRKDRYQPFELLVDIEGLDREQLVSGELVPNWADVSLATRPAGAAIFIDDEPTGQVTPATVEVLAGEHEIMLKAPGHKSHRQRILVAPLEQVALPEIRLQQADGLLTVTTAPPGAGVTLDGQFQGKTPVELAVKSGTRYRVQVFKAGYAAREASASVPSGAERTVHLDLERLTGQVVVTADPPEAVLYVDGRARGAANQTLTLPTAAHQIDIRLDGYAGYSTEITPKSGLTQEIKVRLLTLEEARIAALRPVITTAAGQELVLLRPKPFTMGASRRQPGRRANETLREVTMARLFYLGRHEVTNAQFKQFAAGHASGDFEEHALDDDDQPVVRVGWEEAALYCNWLSGRDGLPPFYRTEFGKVVGINPAATGYRLPTEAEWAWAARQVDGVEGELRFPWGGNLPPPDRHGNYADRSASHLVGRIIFGYNDNHIVAAPVGTFAPNRLGIHDLAGNVAEWVNDFYEIPGPEPVTDPLGPDQADYHVIRGSSWMHGTITDLRLSYRDYGVDGREDVGFRIARFAEAQ